MEKQFSTIRSQLLYEQTIMEKRTQSRIDKSMNDDNNNEDAIDIQVQPPMTKQSKWDTNLILHYTHEQRLGRLTKINDIFTHLIFDKQLSSTTIHSTNNQTNSIDQFIKHIIKQTISTAETIAEHYVQQTPPIVDTIKTPIGNHQSNMVQRAQYNIEQTLKIIFQTNINGID
ncbi:unnamed protein product [Rotaria sordida]|uniref:Uncharacterized protein n=1 Tax=Rotaria sordida TaxID=392033 RepID=A0A819SKH7_9BILA|nr:unnamed protein product [Rotaria sordida]CAF1440024.1 unnamed protein product [Rotaria sordida]CAF4053457.1 unnamed protein product [Rotaria sordida]CAF4055742.1 unnamed protein product [Rotaria sordida]